MKIEVNDTAKLVSVWLTRAESENRELKESLQPLFKEFKAKKYTVAVYESGNESLAELTGELLIYNRVRLMEKAK